MMKKRLALPLSERERYLLLLFLDLIAVNSALFFALVLRPEYGLNFQPSFRQLAWFLILSFIWILAAYVFDLYDLSVAGNFPKSSLSIIKAGFVTCAIYLLIPYITPLLPLYRRYLILFFLLTIFFLFILRGCYILIASQPLFKRNALIIGTGWQALTIAKAIADFGQKIYKIAGFVELAGSETLEGNQEGKGPEDYRKEGGAAGGPCGQSKERKNRDDYKNWSEKSEEPARAVLIEVREREEREDEIGEKREKNERSEIESLAPILGRVDDLKILIGENRPSTIILAYSGEVNGMLLKELAECLELGVEIIPMAILYERLTGRVPVEHLGNQWYVAIPFLYPGTITMWSMIKRLMDLVLASLGLIFLSLVTPLIALAIYIDSPGPIFYMQERVGKGGRRFKAIKFRSMIPEAEKDGPVWAQRGDRRVTRVGKILRRTHLDEFPQFINILKGEMSVVGPRAERPEFVEELRQEIPFYCVRHAVRPGMAGWGLVKQGYGASKEDALVKLQYDLYYIKHQSLWLDIVILLKAVIDTLTFRGRA